MTTIAAESQRHEARAQGRSARFSVALLDDWSRLTTQCDAAGATPFQDRRWLDAWYGAFAAEPHVTPVVAIISDAETSQHAMTLPLISRVVNGLTVVEFADLALTDYNGPVLGPAAPQDAARARALWGELRRALRGTADMIRLQKMPVDVGDRINPLSLLDAAGTCALNGNMVATGDDYEAWRFTLDRTVRKELERSWRVFTRSPNAGFHVETDPDHALHLLATTETQQEARMTSLGRDFVLNDATAAAFYRRVVGHVGDGFAVISALTDGDAIVATLLGIRSGDRYVMIRISNAGGQWSNCSPGRLIIARTMEALHKDGVRQFDFSIGNYSYKRRFNVAPIPLIDLSAALSPRGWPSIAKDRAVHWLRERPALDRRLRKLLGKA